MLSWRDIGEELSRSRDTTIYDIRKLALFLVIRVRVSVTERRSACHSAESLFGVLLFMFINMFMNIILIHNSLGSPGKVSAYASVRDSVRIRLEGKGFE